MMMKKGDLVKLVLPGNTAGWRTREVVVSWQRDYGVVDAPLATRFPEGTLAVFLGDEPGGLERDDPSILIEGRVGWVWSKYLEAV
jgi:hypothetical protein